MFNTKQNMDIILLYVYTYDAPFLRKINFKLTFKNTFGIKKSRPIC